MGKYINLKNIIIVGLAIVIVFLSQCEGTIQPTPDPEVITVTETKYDTIEKTITAYVPKWRTKIIRFKDTIRTTIHDTLKIDTSAVIEDYYSTYAYSDTIQGDSVNFIVNDTVSQNTILSRSIDYKLIYPTTTITNTIYENKREFYMGIGVGGNQHQIGYFGPEFLLRTKKKQAYGLGIGLTGDLKPSIGFRMYWKL